jgi:hypothetical protein
MLIRDNLRVLARWETAGGCYETWPGGISPETEEDDCPWDEFALVDFFWCGGFGFAAHGWWWGTRFGDGGGRNFSWSVAWILIVTGVNGRVRFWSGFEARLGKFLLMGRAGLLSSWVCYFGWLIVNHVLTGKRLRISHGVSTKFIVRSHRLAKNTHSGSMDDRPILSKTKQGFHAASETGIPTRWVTAKCDIFDELIDLTRWGAFSKPFAVRKRNAFTMMERDT